MKSLGFSLTLSLCFFTFSACVDEHDNLMKELNDPSPVKRAGAVKSLAKLGDDEAYMLVSRSLDDSSVVVRIAAVQALGKFAKRDTTAAITRASMDNDPEVRLAVVKELARRKGDLPRKLLLKMLDRGEDNREVRKELLNTLEKLGWQGARLAGELSESRMNEARKKFSEGTLKERIEAIKQAARSVNPGGIDLVLEGLKYDDTDVVISAIHSLDGRGGGRALRALQLLVVNGNRGIRKEVVDALGKYGKKGLSILEDALRDVDPRIRIAALDSFEKNRQKPQEHLLCKLLADEDKAVALKAASMLGNSAKCDLSHLLQSLRGDDLQSARDALDILANIGGDSVQEAIRKTISSKCKLDELSLHFALVMSGQKDKGLEEFFLREFKSSMDKVRKLNESWIKEELPPLKGADNSEADDKRLSEEQLKALYKKHGLGPVRPDSPRGINDLLAGYREDEENRSKLKLILPVSDGEIKHLAMVLDGLLRLNRQEGIKAVHEILALSDTRILKQVANVLDEQKISEPLNDDELKLFKKALDGADLENEKVLVNWLARTKDQRVVPILLSSIKKRKWKRNAILVDALGELGSKSAVKKLVDLLKGYTSISAAQALAKIGDKSAIDGLKKSLDYAGPAEKMVFMYVLAKLGYKDVLQLVKPDLDDPDPEVRRNAVVILGQLGGEDAIEAVKGLRYDLDRFVRQEVKKVIEKDVTGVKSDVRQEKTDQRRSGEPSP